MRIAAYNIKKVYEIGGAFSKEKVNALRGINIKIKENDIVALVGQNGSGKSTLGMILSLLIKPDEGTIFFDVPDWVISRYETALLKNDMKTIIDIEDNYSIKNKDKYELKSIRRKIGVMFQDTYSSLDERMQVKDIILEPIFASNGSREQANESLERIKKDLEINDELLDMYPYELSDGQRQMVGIARSLIMNPLFIFLDEPTSNLDSINQHKILDIFKNINSKYKTSMLIATHNITNANYVSNHIVVMFRGDIVESGPSKEIVNNPRHPYTKDLISIAMRKFNFEQSVLDRSYKSKIRGCIYHRICPVSFEICGWTVEEISEDLERIFKIRMKPLSMEIKDDKLIIKNVNKSEINTIIKDYKNKFRSLYAIKSVNELNDTIELVVSKYIDPAIHSINDVDVKCHLFEGDVSKLL